MVTLHDYNEGGTCLSDSRKKKPTRCFNDFEIRSYADAEIIAGIK